MANMSYCRFQNTLSDLYDCYDHWTEHVSNYEHSARRKLYSLCRDIIDNFEEDMENPKAPWEEEGEEE